MSREPSRVSVDAVLAEVEKTKRELTDIMNVDSPLRDRVRGEMGMDGIQRGVHAVIRLMTRLHAVAARAELTLPVAGSAAIAEVLDRHYYDAGWSKEHQGFRCICGWIGGSHIRHVTDELLAAGILRDEATVKAEALEEAVSSGEFPGLTLARDWVSARAVALRAGEVL
jgi:hypothetical protein